MNAPDATVTDRRLALVAYVLVGFMVLYLAAHLVAYTVRHDGNPARPHATSYQRPSGHR